MLHLGASSFRSKPLASQQSAITHSCVAAFRLGPFTDLKEGVFLSQINLTEVSKVKNKMGHAVPKASRPKKIQVVITNPMKGMKWNTHIKTTFTPKCISNISVKYKVIPSGCLLLELYFSLLSHLQG